MAERYRLPDEPSPGSLQRLAVRPTWPLLAVMFAGPWLSWPWFVFNAWVVGTPTRRAETAWAVGGLLGGFVLFFMIETAYVRLQLPEAAGPYLLTLLTVWKIGISYALYALQSRGFELFEWYGGTPRSGIAVVLLGLVLSGMVGDSLGFVALVVL